jgi:hypothetical protein
MQSRWQKAAAQSIANSTASAVVIRLNAVSAGHPALLRRSAAMLRDMRARPVAAAAAATSALLAVGAVDCELTELLLEIAAADRCAHLKTWQALALVTLAADADFFVTAAAARNLARFVTADETRPALFGDGRMTHGARQRLVLAFVGLAAKTGLREDAVFDLARHELPHMRAAECMVFLRAFSHESNTVELVIGRLYGIVTRGAALPGAIGSTADVEGSFFSRTFRSPFAAAWEDAPGEIYEMQPQPTNVPDDWVEDDGDDAGAATESGDGDDGASDAVEVVTGEPLVPLAHAIEIAGKAAAVVEHRRFRRRNARLRLFANGILTHAVRVAEDGGGGEAMALADVVAAVTCCGALRLRSLAMRLLLGNAARLRHLTLGGWTAVVTAMLLAPVTSAALRRDMVAFGFKHRRAFVVHQHTAFIRCLGRWAPDLPPLTAAACADLANATSGFAAGRSERETLAFRRDGDAALSFNDALALFTAMGAVPALRECPPRRHVLDLLMESFTETRSHVHGQTSLGKACRVAGQLTHVRTWDLRAVEEYYVVLATGLTRSAKLIPTVALVTLLRFLLVRQVPRVEAAMAALTARLVAAVDDLTIDSTLKVLELVLLSGGGVARSLPALLLSRLTPESVAVMPLDDVAVVAAAIARFGAADAQLPENVARRAVGLAEAEL